MAEYGSIDKPLIRVMYKERAVCTNVNFTFPEGSLFQTASVQQKGTEAETLSRKVNQA